MYLGLKEDMPATNLFSLTLPHVIPVCQLLLATVVKPCNQFNEQLEYLITVVFLSFTSQRKDRLLELNIAENLYVK